MRFVAGLLLLTSCAWAASVTSWEMASYQDFLRGRFHNLSLRRDGTITLAPTLQPVFASGQAVIWSIAQAPDGSLYAGTGNRGRLYRIDRSHHASLVWTADQPELFAVAVDGNGDVYVGTSPDGKVYRVHNGKADLYFDPHQKYIWALAFGPDGALYVGTGDEGRVFRVRAAGNGEEFYATGQSHVTGFSFDLQGKLLAGTEPNGILYRISAKDKAFVLYDANLPEIRAIANGPDGSIYAVGLGGSVARKTQTATQAAQALLQSGSTPVVTTSITVTANAQAGPEIKPPAASDPNKAAQAAVAAANTALAASNPQSLEISGVEKSAIYRIRSDNTVETLWSSKDENVFDLLARKDRLWFSTDDGGRIYSLTEDRKLTLVAQTDEAEATRLIDQNGAVYAATGNMGSVYELGASNAADGTYESPIFDAQNVARWGRVRWSCRGNVTIATRSGNSLRPDRTWSDWSPALSDPHGSQIASPNARYIQWKALLSGAGASSPALENFSLAFLPQNSPPVIRSVIITTGTPTAAATTKTATTIGASPATSAYSITVTDTGDPGPATSTGTPTQTISRAASQSLIVSWQADDPDGDRLVYALWFRGEDESEWKLLRTGLHESSFNLDGDSLADGRYYFKVVASDREANPPDQTETTELISSPILIDNTPPLIHVQSANRDGRNAVVRFAASDASSPLRRCEYSLDAGPWMAINATDGVIDSPEEQFRLETPLPAGEHVIVLRVVDSGGNAGLGKVVIR